MPTDLETLIAILILGLGTARLSALVVLDDITENLRERLFMHFPPEDNDRRGWYFQCYDRADKDERAEQRQWDASWKHRWIHRGDIMRQPTFIGRLFACHKCIGVWIAFANLGAYLLCPEPVVAFNVALAVSFLSLALVGRYYRG